jgi:predicted transposase YbfD/YdcC
VIFPPQRIAQTCELNRGRTEARCVVAFDTTATRIDFPFAEQAARLTRCVDSRRTPAEEIETEYLITSRAGAQMNAEQMLRQDRQYWGIETGLHLRLDVIAGEDRSRVRDRNAVMNLAVIRRAVVSLAVQWIRRQPNQRLATMSGFYDFMSAQNSKMAFKLVTASKYLKLSHL